MNNQEKEQAYRWNDFQILIAPLGLMFFFNIIANWGISRGGNAYIIGILLMYISWTIVYFAFIKENKINAHTNKKTKFTRRKNLE